MIDRYILNGHEPEYCDDLMKWARWFEKADRHVGDDRIGAVRVSTVFLGVDCSFGAGPALLFETMIFGGLHNDYQTRCSTWNEAVEQHAVALKLVSP